ncbi:hypothetical protein HDV03_002074 [Kappamyces sp. JEL0829]|nr:hypothetical protein HDV03_002074 [Kappamyces sp. JEL0829]
MLSLLPLFSVAFSSPSPLPIAWGFATSAYQIEGAWNVSGKGLRVRVTARNECLGQKDDIAILGSLKATAYRFSVSWPRIFPNCNGQVNQAGLQFYSDMIDEIIKNGATPILTMFHWDTPQACHDQYKSWSNRQIITDFTNYADVLLQAFGDRVQHFLTINEPAAMCGRAYGKLDPNDKWVWPPGMMVSLQGKYDCLHLVNLAHGSVVQMARKKYASKNFKFGIPLIIELGLPNDPNSAADIKLAKDTTTAQSDSIWGPMFFGDYPQYLKDLHAQNDPTWDYFEGSFLNSFTDAEKQMMKGTIDFLGVNYYSAKYKSATGAQVPSFPVGGASWQNIYPSGIRNITKLLSEYYGNLEVIITECGTAVPNEKNMTLDQRVNDVFRQNFFQGVTSALSDAVLIDKTPIKAFLAWSLLDNLEWLTFDQFWGLVDIDQNGKTLNRSVKGTAKFLSSYFSNAKSPYTLPSPSGGTVSTVTPKGASSSATLSGLVAAIVVLVSML